MKPTLGQTLYRLPIGNRARRGVEHELTPVVVCSVGRKYFSVKEPDSRYPNETKHHIDTGFEVSDYSSTYQIYYSEQEYLDECESKRLNNALREAFQYYGKSNFTLDQLRAVSAILFPEKP